MKLIRLIQPSAVLAIAIAFSLLSGCVVVRDRKPETVSTSTTTTRSLSTPAATTVERTTVY